MNRHQKQPHLKVRNPAYRQAFQRIEAALKRTSEGRENEKIDWARRALFGALPEDMEKSGAVKLPE
jgi:hypothetical protein